MIIWKDIIGFENYYQISNTGEVKSLKRKVLHKRRGLIDIPETILKQYISTSGYKAICLQKEGRTYTKYVHRLVAINFIENKLDKKTVNHIDGNKLNNNIENLEWATFSENMKHARNSNLLKNRLKKEEIEEIKKLIQEQKSDTEISKKFNVTRMNISLIRRGITWKN